MTTVSEHMTKIVRNIDAKFFLNDKEISLPDMLSDTGLLPALARRADQLCSLCFGYGIGVSYDEAEPSILGVKVVFDDVTPMLLRYLTLTDVIIDMVTYATDKQHVILDELLYD